MRNSIFQKILLGSACLTFAACTPAPPDPRPFRVRVADDVLKRQQYKVAEATGILPAEGAPGSLCVYTKTRILGIPSGTAGLYWIGTSLNGNSTLMSAHAPGDIGSALAVVIRCPHPFELYKPFPEYEALKAKKAAQPAT